MRLVVAFLNVSWHDLALCELHRAANDPLKSLVGAVVLKTSGLSAAEDANTGAQISATVITPASFFVNIYVLALLWVGIV